MASDTQQLLQRSLLGEAVDELDGVAVFVWNAERRYVAVNEAACELTGSSRGELIGMHVGDLTPDGEQLIDRVQSRDATDGSSTFRRIDGQRVEIEWTTLHTRIAGLPYMVSIVRRAGR